MAREFFKNLPDTSTPLNAPRLNNFLNGNEAMGSIVVDDITCKNVLDYQLMENAYVTNDGTYTISNYNMISHYISVNSGEQWTASVKQSINAICIVQYNSSKTFIKRDIVYNSTINTVTLDANAKYIRAFFNQDSSTTMTTNILTDLEAQLEKGKTKTNYVEHKEYANDFSNLLQCVYKKTIWGNVLTNTGISVNSGAGGRTYLVCWSTHSSTGDSTSSYIGMLRCGYNGNNYSLIEIARSTGSTSSLLVTFSIDDNGNLQYQNSASGGASKVFIYQLT